MMSQRTFKRYGTDKYILSLVYDDWYKKAVKNKIWVARSIAYVGLTAQPLFTLSHHHQMCFDLL